MAELSEQKLQARKVWSSGDYPSIVRFIDDVGDLAVEVAQVKDGDVVLDVACGAGNATIPAAQTGAKVTGLDLTPELIEAGKAAAAEAGVEIEWIEGDAEDLPFEDGSFGVVLSVMGAMFGPDHKQTAGEMARVLAPGGRMANVSWTPEGSTGKFFMTIGKHMPPPPEGFQPPVLWGSEEHITELFADTGVDPSFQRGQVEFSFDSVEGGVEELSEKLGPLVMAKAALEPEGKWDALRADLATLMNELNEADDGSLRYPGEYLVTRGEKAG